MENLDPNQLPMLPDPLSDTPTPALLEPAPTAAPKPTGSNSWFQTQRGKLVLAISAIVALILIVLFNQQLGQLLNLFGIKAAQTVELSNTSTPNFSDPTHQQFDSNGVEDPTKSLFVVDGSGRLILNNPGQEPPQ